MTLFPRFWSHCLNNSVQDELLSVFLGLIRLWPYTVGVLPPGLLGYSPLGVQGPSAAGSWLFSFRLCSPWVSLGPSPAPALAPGLRCLGSRPSPPPSRPTCDSALRRPAQGRAHGWKSECVLVSAPVPSQHVYCLPLPQRSGPPALHLVSLECLNKSIIQTRPPT